MQLQIYAHTFSLTPAIEQVIRGQIADKLAPYDDKVITTDVFLKDVNGPKGGADKAVTMDIRLRDGRNVTIKVVHADLYRAVRLCVKSVRRRVQSSIEKCRQIVRADVRSVRRFAPAELAGRHDSE